MGQRTKWEKKLYMKIKQQHSYDYGYDNGVRAMQTTQQRCDQSKNGQYFTTDMKCPCKVCAHTHRRRRQRRNEYIHFFIIIFEAIWVTNSIVIVFIYLFFLILGTQAEWFGVILCVYYELSKRQWNRERRKPNILCCFHACTSEIHRKSKNLHLKMQLTYHPSAITHKLLLFTIFFSFSSNLHYFFFFGFLSFTLSFRVSVCARSAIWSWASYVKKWPMAKNRKCFY